MYITEQEAYIAFLQQKEQELLETCCGRRYSRVTSTCRRIKTRVRRICTRFGAIVYRFVYLRDKLGRVFSPLLEFLDIRKYQHMSDDLKNRLRDKASKMTYADAVEDIANSFGFRIHRQTLWNMSQEAGGPAFAGPGERHVILLADGTKVRSNRGGHHEPRVVMSVNPETGGKRLLAFSVDKSWEEICNDIDFSGFRVLVADAEPGLRDNLVKAQMAFQFCHQHAERDLAFYLWKDGVPNLARNEFMKPFKATLYTVQSSTANYFQHKDKGKLRWRLAWARKRIAAIEKKLEERGLAQASEFLTRKKEYLFTAAVLALRENLKVPWTTNQMERCMKELGKRTKQKSMRWSASGLGTILRAVLKRYFLPPEERNYKKIFGGDT